MCDQGINVSISSNTVWAGPIEPNVSIYLNFYLTKKNLVKNWLKSFEKRISIDYKWE